MCLNSYQYLSQDSSIQKREKERMYLLGWVKLCCSNKLCTHVSREGCVYHPFCWGINIWTYSYRLPSQEEDAERFLYTQLNVSGGNGSTFMPRTTSAPLLDHQKGRGNSGVALRRQGTTVCYKHQKNHLTDSNQSYLRVIFTYTSSVCTFWLWLK